MYVLHKTEQVNSDITVQIMKQGRPGAKLKIFLLFRFIVGYIMTFQVKHLSQ